MSHKNTSLLSALLILFLNIGYVPYSLAQERSGLNQEPWKPDTSFFAPSTFSLPLEIPTETYATYHKRPEHGSSDKLAKRQIKDSLNEIKIKYYLPNTPAYKNDPDSIAVTTNFEANPVQNVTPMDNAMAISPDGIIVSAVNSNWCVYDDGGNQLLFRTFKQLSADPSLTSRFFDPRVMYDPVIERFVMVVLHGVLASDSKVLVFVSKEKDPLQGWHVYSFSGDPFNEGVMSDYPHLGISQNHVWVSLNLFNDQNSLFKKSIMLVLDKSDLAAGNTAEARIYQDIKTLDDKNAFSLVPANNHNGIGAAGMHFLTSKDRGGEELYLFYFDPEGGIKERTTIKTGPYALPPEALQFNEATLLDGGDCRITGAFYRNGLIHFCLNTNSQNFRNAIYYGRVDVGTKLCEARTIVRTKDIAYGSPVSFGAYDANRAVLIPLVYVSENEYPSIGYIYVDEGMRDYDLVSVYEGLSPQIAPSGEINRWGDYCTAVSVTTSSKPKIWFAAAGGGSANRWQNMLIEVEGATDSISSAPSQTEFRVFPNPVGALLKIDLKLVYSQNVEINLYDAQGKRIEQIWKGVMSKGANQVIFEPRTKASGLYYVRILSDNTILHTETLFIE